MLPPVHIHNARLIAGLFLFAHVMGFLFFPIKLLTFSTLYAAVVVAALTLFCFLPRKWLRKVWGLVAIVAVAAIGVTAVKMYGDLTLINGMDRGALLLRSPVVAVLAVMLIEARSRRK